MCCPRILFISKPLAQPTRAEIYFRARKYPHNSYCIFLGHPSKHPEGLKCNLVIVGNKCNGIRLDMDGASNAQPECFVRVRLHLEA